MLPTRYQFSSEFGSGFQSVTSGPSLAEESREASRMMLDWLVLIVAFVAISLQIKITTNVSPNRFAKDE